MINPPKFLKGYINRISERDYWQETSTRIWDNVAFRWLIELSITPISHSSNTTQTPFQYNGMDIIVGNWIADSTGRAFLIQRVEQTSVFSASIVIEDVDQYNTYKDLSVSGYGGPTIGFCGIFEISSDGLPILEGMPAGIFPETQISEIISRFDNKNPKTTFVKVNQTNHGFSVGDFIKIDEDNEGRYKLVTADQSNSAIGIVTETFGPGINYFNFRPFGKLIDQINPPLEGEYGDIYYIDPYNPGKVTSTRPNRNSKPIYLRLDSDRRGILFNISADENTMPVSLVIRPNDNQTLFQMPENTSDMITMSINGIENKNYLFDRQTKQLLFDPIATGYGVDPQDEIIFIYKIG